MSIIRSVRPVRDFTIINNSVCLDSRLSMRALGLLVRLLSRPDNWQTNSEILAREFDVGREQMQKVLRELVSFGYMELVKTRHDSGKITSAWYVFDEPKTEKPATGKPAPEKPYAGKSVAFNKTDLTRTDNQSTQPDGFAQFWQEYPKKVAKPAALRAYKSAKLKTKDQDQIVKDLSDKKDSEEWKKEGGKYIPHPATYLNQRRWEDVGEQKSCGVLPGAI